MPRWQAAAEEGERAVMRVEHHLLRLARVGPHEQHPAVAQPHLRHLDLGGGAAQHHDLVAPVELERLARRERERHEGVARSCALLAPACRGVAAHRIVAALIARDAQVLEDADQPQTLTPRQQVIGRQPALKLRRPRPQPRTRLHLPLVGEAGLARAQDLADGVACDPQLPGDRLDRLALNEVRPPDPRNRFHNQHLPHHPNCRAASCHRSGGQFWTPITPTGGQTSTPIHNGSTRGSPTHVPEARPRGRLVQSADLPGTVLGSGRLLRDTWRSLPALRVHRRRRDHECRDLLRLCPGRRSVRQVGEQPAHHTCLRCGVRAPAHWLGRRPGARPDGRQVSLGAHHRGVPIDMIGFRSMAERKPSFRQGAERSIDLVRGFPIRTLY